MKISILSLITSCLWVSLATAQLSDRGPREASVSGAIQYILGLDGNVTPEDDVFFERISSDSISDEQINKLLQSLSTIELVEFIRNEKLSKYHDDAANIYGERYGKRPIYVNDDRIKDNFQIFKNEVVFKSISVFKEFVQPIKHKIEALKLDFLFLRNELRDTLDFVRVNLAETLKKLTLRNVEHHKFELLKDFSFASVEELSLYGCDLHKNGLDWKQMFPSVRRIAATFTKFTEPTWVQTNFPLITHLQVDIGSNIYLSEEDILNILESNRNINNLSIVSCTPNLLRIINERYPNIKSLGIIGLSYLFGGIEEPVEMDHVESFLYEDSIDYAFAFIQFNHLKELKWRSLMYPEDIFINFIGNHSKQIETLITEDTAITDEHLKQMANMERLHRVSFDFDPTEKTLFVTGNGLANFIKANENITELRLLRARKELLEDVFPAFRANGLGDWLDSPYPPLSDEANVCFKNPQKSTTEWVDTTQFLRNNFY